MASFENFIGGGAEPDRMFPMEASNSQFDLNSLGLTERNEPVNGSHKMAGQALSRETKDQFRSGIFEEIFTVVDLTKRMRRIEELKKFDGLDAVNQGTRQTAVRLLCSECLSVLEDMHQILKMLSERFPEHVNRQNTKFGGTPVPERIFLPLPASIPSNKTKASPEPIPDTQGQTNEPINQEPVHEVNTSKEQKYRKVKGIQPIGLDEAPVDLLDGSSVPLLIGITATNVLSMGRGSHAVEAQVSYFSDPTSQDDRVWRKHGLCCCSIM